MSNEFIWEERYVVFKVSDLGNSLKGDEIRRLAREYAEQRRLKGKKPLECVVVEKDWPEYEPAWRAIEARVTGAPYEPAVQVAARIMNHELITERDALRAKIEAMEKQEPVMWANSSTINSSRINKERGGHGDQHTCSETQTTYHDTPLYALPGEQPAPSVPDGWLQHAARMAALARKLREPDWHFESIREMQRELCALEEAALAAAPEAKP